MLIVKVELWSAVTGEKTEIARMRIANTGGTDTRGNYEVQTLRGSNATQLLVSLVKKSYTREGSVRNYPRKRHHVWNLVALALEAMEYGGDKSVKVRPTEVDHTTRVVEVA